MVLEKRLWHLQGSVRIYAHSNLVHLDSIKEKLLSQVSDSVSSLEKYTSSDKNFQTLIGPTLDRVNQPLRCSTDESLMFL